MITVLFTLDKIFIFLKAVNDSYIENNMLRIYSSVQYIQSQLRYLLNLVEFVGTSHQQINILNKLLK